MDNGIIITCILLSQFACFLTFPTCVRQIKVPNPCTIRHDDLSVHHMFCWIVRARTLSVMLARPYAICPNIFQYKTQMQNTIQNTNAKHKCKTQMQNAKQIHNKMQNKMQNKCIIHDIIQNKYTTNATIKQCMLYNFKYIATTTRIYPMQSQCTQRQYLSHEIYIYICKQHTKQNA